MTELPPPTVPASDVPKRSKANLLGWVAVAVVVVLVIGALTKNDDSDGDDLEHAAFTVCKDFVKDRLKSPSSASFRNFFEDDGEVRVTGNGPYRVVSTVDADNSFGANVRSEFVCVVNRVGDDRWELDSLTIDD